MIKYLIALFTGLLLGTFAAIALLYYNPMAIQNKLSPVTVSDTNTILLEYSAVAADSILYTNNGESRINPFPERVEQLWEAPIRNTDILVSMMMNSRNQPVGIGIKFMSDSEETRLINGEALVNSAWHIHMPGRGSLFIEQTENYWNYLRKIVVPAYWSSSDSWRGTWIGNVTSGPGSLGTALVTGGSGEFAELQTEAVESLTARAYSLDGGPVAVDGNLTIELRRDSEIQAADTGDP